MLSTGPDIRIGLTGQALFSDRVHFVSEGGQLGNQRSRNILVQLDLHATFGTDGTGRSSSADAAANAITARTSSTDTVG